MDGQAECRKSRAALTTEVRVAPHKARHGTAGQAGIPRLSINRRKGALSLLLPPPVHPPRCGYRGIAAVGAAVVSTSATAAAAVVVVVVVGAE